MRELWYVKVRNVQTGEEIQRIASLVDGLVGSSGATAQMKAYLLDNGRAEPDLVPPARMLSRERSAHERVRRRSALREAPLSASAVRTAVGGNEGIVTQEGLR